MEPGPCFNVLVGNGQSMIVDGVVPKLPITLQEHELTLNIFYNGKFLTLQEERCTPYKLA